MVYDVDFIKNNLLVDFSESIIGKQPGGGSSDYKKLSNKPSINGHELNGDLTSAELDISVETDKSLNVSDIAADSKTVGDEFIKIRGNLLPKFASFPAAPTDLTVEWNSEKNSAEITSTRTVSYLYPLYENTYDLDSNISGWSEYLEYGKTYDIQFSSTSHDVTLYISDTNGDRFVNGNDAFCVNEGEPWMIAIQIASGNVSANIDISMLFTSSLVDLLTAGKHTAILG